jgi:phosphohistidine phosphatase SixA
MLGRMVAAAVLTLAAGASRASEPAWEALKQGGTVALMRHARAPGTGDPPGFDLGDCASQRNLSEEGREQARQIGAAFRARRVDVQVVLSSRWCRALETARIAFGDLVQAFPLLDSFFAGRGERDTQTKRVLQQIDEWRGHRGVLVLVTHQVNITAATGIVPAEGETVVLAPNGRGGADVIGTLRP